MSLWLALLWVAYSALGLGIFLVCRKRVADIAQQVAEEIDHRVRRALKAERDADAQLCDAFVAFQNPADAVQAYQRAQSEIDGVPQTSPTWAWSHSDLDLLRKRAVTEESASRSRGPIVGSIVAVLALTVAAGVATVILSNSVQPALAPPTAVANTGGNPGGALPPPVSLPTAPQTWPAPLDDANDKATTSAPGAAAPQQSSSPNVDKDAPGSNGTDATESQPNDTLAAPFPAADEDTPSGKGIDAVDGEPCEEGENP